MNGDREIAHARELLANFGFRNDYTERDVEAVHAAIGQSQSNFGMVRLKIGALLIAVQDKELWRGRAESFGAYLDDHKIKRAAAKQYMGVAEKLLLEFKLTEAEILSISKCSMSTMLKACEIMTRDNREEIIGVLENLSDKDAAHVLGDYQAYQEPLTKQGKAPPKQIRRIVQSYFDLPADMRTEFLASIGIANVEWAKT